MTKWQRRAFWLREHPAVITLEAIGLISLIFAAFIFLFELREKQDERSARAWQLITTVAPGNSGKIGALEYLNSQSFCLPEINFEQWCWKKRTPLAGIDLSIERHNGIDDGGRAKHNEPVYLQGVQLDRAVIKGVNFRGSSLHGASFDFANIQTSNFEEADLSGASFKNTSFFRVTLKPAFIPSPEFPDFSGSTFWHTSISGNLEGASFTDVEFLVDKIASAYFYTSTFKRAHFQGVKLTDIDFGAADLSQANLTETIIKRTNFSEATFWRTDFTDAEIENSNFKAAWIAQANFSRATFLKTSFEKARFDEVSARTLNLPLAELKGAYICHYQITNDTLQKFADLFTFIPVACAE